MTSTEVRPDDVAEGVPAEDDTLTERRFRALALRNAGATYPQIAERTGTTTATARRDVTAALKTVMSEPAEDMIARQRAILLDLHKANYAQALRRDPDATKVVFDCLKHEAQLFGLYAPARVDVGVTDTEFAEQAVKLITSLNLSPSRELVVSADASAATHPSTVIDAEIAEVVAEALAPAETQEDEPWSNV